MSNPSTPALRSLQFSADGKTLIGRNSAVNKIGSKSPASSFKSQKDDASPENESKITSFFPSGKTEFKESDLLALSARRYDDTKRLDSANMEKDGKKSAGVNTQLKLKHMKDEEKVPQLFYSTGPSKSYWKSLADDVRRQWEAATLDKIQAESEIDDLLEEKWKLEEELAKYKDYFELRDYANIVLGPEDD